MIRVDAPVVAVPADRPEQTVIPGRDTVRAAVTRLVGDRVPIAAGEDRLADGCGVDIAVAPRFHRSDQFEASGQTQVGRQRDGENGAGAVTQGDGGGAGDETEARLGLPTVDPVRDGVARLVDAL